METLHPLGIDLHKIGLGQVGKFFLQQGHRLARVRRAGAHDKRVRQWIIR